MGGFLKSYSTPSAVFKNPCQKSTMDKLFENRSKTGDIKFVIDAEVIPAHRCVLAALSPKYETQFYGSMAEKDTITIEDVSSAAFKEFLQFFYINEVTLTIENIEDVLNLAKQSLVDELVDECTNFLLYIVGLDNLMSCYRLALVYDVKQLEEFCVKHIGANIKSVFKTMDFLNCERDMLSHVLAIDSLNCNEIDVFDACISWAQAKCERDEIDASKRGNLRAVLGEAVYKIRYGSMTFEEFAAQKRKYSGLFSAEESIDVFNAIALNANGELDLSIFGDIISKPRQTTNASYLECSFCRLPCCCRFDTVNDQDFIAFYCDKEIKLNGFSICNRIVHNIEVLVLINSRDKVHNLEKTISFSDDTTTVIFDNSVVIANCSWCIIHIRSKAFERSGSHLQGFFAEKYTKEHGVTFRFSDYKCNNLNLITKLLFSITDKC